MTTRQNPKSEKHRGQTGPLGITEDQIIEAMRANMGVIPAAAQVLKCTAQNIRQRINASSALLGFMAEFDEEVLDIAEGVVRLALQNKDATTARWLLDRKGKGRGYRQLTELGGIGGAPIQVAATTQAVEAPTTPQEIALARRRFIDAGNDAGA